MEKLDPTTQSLLDTRDSLRRKAVWLQLYGDSHLTVEESKDKT